MSALVILSLTGCSDSSDPSSQDENEDDTNPVAMINISDVTENADFLMLCQDGSYIMGDFNADNG